MFYCQITGKLSQPGEKVNRITIETRPREYFEERYDEETDSYQLQLVGRGFEIVKEVFATKEGLALWNKTQASLQVSEPEKK